MIWAGTIWDGAGGRRDSGEGEGGERDDFTGFGIWGLGFSLYMWASKKYEREVDVSWARELNVSGALELGGAHLFFSDRQRDGIHMFSDRRFNAKY